MLFILLILLISINQVTLHEASKAITKCPKQCACSAENMIDLPLMKWLTIPMNKYWQQTDSLDDNQVWDNTEEVSLQQNPLVHFAFCMSQLDVEFINRNEFTPYIEALTLLYGPDSINRTIDHELSSFQELLALDIQGYQSVSEANSEIFLEHNALLGLKQLQYLNIQYIRLIPNPNSTNKDIPQAAYDYLETIRSRQQTSNELQQNLTFILPDEEEILSYHEYKNKPQRRQNLTFIEPDEPEIIPYHKFKNQAKEKITSTEAESSNERTSRNTVISTFSHLENLQFLRLYRCHLESISWEMFDGLKNLQTLSLEDNEITKIPKFAFYGMPNLKILILSNNKLTNINTESLAGLFNLEHLDLTHNQIRHLTDDTFAPLPMLFSMDLRYNPVTSIQSNTFEVLNTTRVLFIENNKNAVTLHSSSFNGLIELEKLLIIGLDVSTLEKSLLRGMSKLRYLKLAGKVEYIHFDAFANSVLLETLILKNCSMRYLSMDAFYGLTNLVTLDLSDNNLQNLPTGIFDGLDSLTELHLTNNKLTTLPNIFGNLPEIKMIRLDGNPWHCSCELTHLPMHVVNRIKQVRMVEKCNIQYDKTPCTSEREEYYAYGPKVTPKCSTPKMYDGWNALYVIQKKLHCLRQSKHLKSHEDNATLSNNITNQIKDEMEPQLMKINYHHEQTAEANEMDNSSLDSLRTVNNTVKAFDEVQDL